MKVHEMIAWLQTLPQDATVEIITAREDNGYGKTTVEFSNVTFTPELSELYDWGTNAAVKEGHPKFGAGFVLTLGSEE